METGFYSIIHNNHTHIINYNYFIRLFGVCTEMAQNVALLSNVSPENGGQEKDRLKNDEHGIVKH